MSEATKKIGFIGAGNMATAIIKGLMHAGGEMSRYINVYDIDALKAAGISPEISVCTDICSLVESSDYIIFAIKPQTFTDVLSELKGHDYGKKVFVSIAAGISGDYIKSYLGSETKVVLVMPNTPLLLGAGASALAKIDPTTDEEFQFVVDIFNSRGLTSVVPPDRMIPIIAVNGSSPALIYRFARAMCDYAKEQGIDYNTALTLFAQTLRGSADMLTNSGYSIDELIKMVSSPGGTTLKALEVFDKLGFDETVKQAAVACTQRGYELSK